MTTIRRTYAYLLAFAGLAMLSVAAANLLQVLIEVLLQSPTVAADNYVRDTVSRYAAIALVGLPVWLVHWWWIERWLVEPDERASSLRRLYLYVVMGASALVAVFSAREALAIAMSLLAGTAATVSWVRPLAFTAPALLVWLAHWRIADRDRALVGELGGSATLRRWYIYGLALVGLAMLLGGAQGLVEALWNILATQGRSTAVFAALPGATATVGLALWLVHWVVLPDRLQEAERRDDGVATLRSVYLFLALTLGVTGCLFGLSQLLYYAVGRLLGVEDPGGVGGNLLEAAAGPASVAIVYGVAWAYQRQALRRQAAAFDEALRQAGVRRLYTYLVSLVALAALATGVAGLLWTLGDVLFNAPAATVGDGWRGQVALFSTLALVGLPVWLLHWRPAPMHEADVRSLARRLYLYLSLIGAMLTLVGSLATALYRVIGLILGETSSVELLTDLAHGAAIAIVASAVAAYHWRVLRADTRRAPSALEPTGVAQTEEPVPARVEEAPLAQAAPTQAVVEIHAADAETLDRALSALRATGVEVTLRQAG